MKPQEMPPIARKTDPRSSHEGETAVQAKRIPNTIRILRWFAEPENYASTAKECERALEIPGAWKRISDLHNQGFLEPAATLAHCSVTKHWARMWFVTVAGRKRLESASTAGQ